MRSFIFKVLEDLQQQNISISDCTFIVPSKRAGTILKYELSKLISQTSFAPTITSIEVFIEEISQLNSTSNTALLFELYTAYKATTPKDKQDSFDVFYRWGQMLLQDFNEIDRYLIDHKHIFNYLSAIKDLNHWSLEAEQTEVVKNYLLFWKSLDKLYSEFTTLLRSKELGYQGLIYRDAQEHLEDYVQNHQAKQHVFLGFNALNASEEIIIQELLASGLAKIYWDIDEAYINNKFHDAALFIRLYKKRWKHYEHNAFNWIATDYKREKTINTYAIPKNIGQAKQIGSILKNLSLDNASLDNTAVILADEALLLPVLNSLPKSIERLNITMGFPLKSIPLASLFELLFSMHKKDTQSFYYKDVIAVLSHEYIRFLIPSTFTEESIFTIEHDNHIYLNLEQLQTFHPDYKEIISLLFNLWKNPEVALTACFSLIKQLKKALQKEKKTHLLDLEYLYRFNTLFNNIELLTQEYNHIKDLKTLFNIYKELLSSETLDFQGEPLKGLQIMGMLESRVLDFETIIIASVNEGVLPSGKTANSFIPFDVKREHNLPTYKEKDAVYTYHFYRLLQRVKNVHLLYNSEIDELKGTEKSRFITQIEIEGIHKMHHQIVAPSITRNTNQLTVIKKNKTLLNQLQNVAAKGFSPSSLTSYIRNPLDFYYQKILKINIETSIEETVAANTLGTVVHNTLETFYKPLENKKLTEEHLDYFITQIGPEISKQFNEVYKKGDVSKGKNLIIYEVAKRYVSNFIGHERALLKQGNVIEILAIETDNTIALKIPELNFPVKLTGKVDRIDRYNGITRIIDYKTGKVDQNQVEIVDWGSITLDYKKYSKSFQILCYALMITETMQIDGPLEAGIIYFKNLNAGFLKFGQKPSSHSRQKNTLITSETLEDFKKELKGLIMDICNKDVDFEEKDLT
jgi:hypothetical protein